MQHFQDDGEFYPAAKLKACRSKLKDSCEGALALRVDKGKSPCRNTLPLLQGVAPRSRKGGRVRSTPTSFNGLPGRQMQALLPCLLLRTRSSTSSMNCGGPTQPSKSVREDRHIPTSVVKESRTVRQTVWMSAGVYREKPQSIVAPTIIEPSLWWRSSCAPGNKLDSLIVQGRSDGQKMCDAKHS